MAKPSQTGSCSRSSSRMVFSELKRDKQSFGVWTPGVQRWGFPAGHVSCGHPPPYDGRAKPCLSPCVLGLRAVCSKKWWENINGVICSFRSSETIGHRFFGFISVKDSRARAESPLCLLPGEHEAGGCGFHRALSPHPGGGWERAFCCPSKRISGTNQLK